MCALPREGIAIERVGAGLRADEQLGDAYLAINPPGTVTAPVAADFFARATRLPVPEGALARWRDAASARPGAAA